MTKLKGFGEDRSYFRDEHGERRQRRSPKRPVNVSVQEHILTQAREIKLNLSQVLENELLNQIRANRQRRWEEDSREAIESYNRFIEKNGVWGKKYRKW